MITVVPSPGSSWATAWAASPKVASRPTQAPAISLLRIAFPPPESQWPAPFGSLQRPDGGPLSVRWVNASGAEPLLHARRGQPQQALGAAAEGPAALAQAGIAQALGDAVEDDGDQHDADPADGSPADVEAAEAGVDREPEAAGADQRADHRHRERQHQGLVQPGHDGAHRQRDLHVEEDLARRRPEGDRRLHQLLADRSEAHTAELQSRG